MRKLLSVIVTITLIMAFAGCATLKMESKVDKPVSMTSMRGTPVRDFERNDRAIWLFWGLIPLSTIPEVDDVVAPHVADRVGVQNLKITTKSSFLDGVVSTLTLNIIMMRSVKIKGQVYDR